MTRLKLVLLVACFLGESVCAAQAGQVVGRVEMSAACMPSVSPAVVWLEPSGGSVAGAAGSASASMQIIQQKDLRFQPRIAAFSLGGGLRFTNSDREPHNVHISGAGVSFNQTIRPGEVVEVTPRAAGLLKIVCDIHIHMRGYVRVVDSPWVAVCDREGNFKIADVPPGQYRIHYWHELGDVESDDVPVGELATDVGTRQLASRVAPTASSLSVSATQSWPEVLDRISVTCAAALDVAARRGANAASAAISLVDDAYLGTFEATDMEVAVASLLGYERVIAIEGDFRILRRQARGVASGTLAPAKYSATLRHLLALLVQAARDLQTLGVADRAQLAHHLEKAGQPLPIATTNSAGVDAQLRSLRLSLDRVSELAEQGSPGDAATELVTVYFDAFEPLERTLNACNPAAVRPLEARFAILRGDIEKGLSGVALARELDALDREIRSALGNAQGGDSAAFGVLFLASFTTLVREGAEVILILAVLGALIAKAGKPRGARRALWTGVSAAVVASGLTAWALGALVGGTRNQTRETGEGVVMLIAAAVLFYVSYWLIAQSESKRWINFLKSATQHGAGNGRLLTLAVAAFLAVYREGAELVLMYQGMAGGQAASGVAAIVGGAMAAIVVLALLAVVVRVTSVRLPMRPFFQVTGMVLFGLSVVFAGNGVLALQSASVLRATGIAWLGRGVPVLGLHPTVQGTAVQGILLAGALAALAVMRRTGGQRDVAGVGQRTREAQAVNGNLEPVRS